MPAIKPGRFTGQQPNLLWAHTIADSATLGATTTETVFGESVTVAANTAWAGFAAGDKLEYFFSGVIACDSTPTIRFAMFYGSVATGALLGRSPTMLLTASGSDTFTIRGSVLFRSATSVVGSLTAHVKTAATLSLSTINIIAATSVATPVAADSAFNLAVTFSAASTTYNVLTREGHLLHYRPGV